MKQHLFESWIGEYALLRGICEVTNRLLARSSTADAAGLAADINRRAETINRAYGECQITVSLQRVEGGAQCIAIQYAAPASVSAMLAGVGL